MILEGVHDFLKRPPDGQDEQQAGADRDRDPEEDKENLAESPCAVVMARSEKSKHPVFSK
jgi:hypothetical protein